MKLTLTALTLALFSISAFAGISLDIDLKNNENGQKIELKKNITVYLDETKTISIPNSNKIVEIKVSDKLPEVMTEEHKSNDKLLIELKIVEIIGKARKIISSPKIITLIGREAKMETFENESQKEAIMSLKVIPTRF
jgi:hypothetical protein